VYWQVGGGRPYGVMSYRNTVGDARTLAALAAITMFYSELPVTNVPERREEDFPIYGNTVWFAGSLLQVDYMLTNAHTGKERIALLAEDLRRLWNLFFLGAVDADFEERVGALVDKGRPPSGAQMSRIYLETLRDYYRGEDGAALPTDGDGEEWMTLSNEYYGPVFAEWSFAMAAAASIVERIAAHDPQTMKAWTAPMWPPGSYTSYDLLRDVGADPVSLDTYQAVIRRMDRDMDQLNEETGR
jgi:oligoendopeptidase F